MTRNLFAVRLFLAAAMAPKHEPPVDVTEDGTKCPTCGIHVSPEARRQCGTCAT